MKLGDILCGLMVVVVLVMIIQIDTTEARKKPGNGKKTVCRYEKKGEESACDAASNMKVITLLLKKGHPATCPPSKTANKPCSDNSLTKRKKVKGCKYEKKNSKWTECDPVTNERTKSMKLKEGSNAQCPATRTKTKSCRKNKASGNSRQDA